jgi:hypothetical protein
MEPAHYTDPLEDALSHGSQRVAQIASLAAATAQVVMQRKALEDARRALRNEEPAAQALGDQERLLQQQARLGWAPAHDAEWMAQADLIQVARAWASAAAHADTDPAAASAMRKCEERLRALHPYAMTRYDQLRADGLSPLGAMREAAALFGLSPTTRTGDPAPARPAIGPGIGEEPSMADGLAVDGPAEPRITDDEDTRPERRGRQIVERLQSRARATGRSELGPDELAMVLEAVTNLPSNVIDTLTQHAGAEALARSEEHRATAAERARAYDLDAAVDLPATPTTDERTLGLVAAHRDTGFADAARAHVAADRSAAQLAAQSFPYSAAEAVQAASTRTVDNAAQTGTRIHSPYVAKHPRRSL